ncbi:MAG: regulatory protein RecX [Thermodesulfobacteriota bacterium]
MAGGKDVIDAALRLLSYRPRSAHELTRRLADKGFEAPEIKGAVGYLTDAGYLDDERYAASLADSRVRNKGWGPSKISADLAAKGIPKEIIKKTMARIGPAEEGTARAAFARWARRNRVVDRPEGKVFEKVFRHLKARGFCTSAIMKALSRSGDEDGGGE